MKKEYIKPYLAVESFQLDAAIAGSCANKITLNQKIDTCTLMDEENDYGDYIFGAQCALDGGMDIVKPQNPDGICYQVFNATDMYVDS